MSVAVELPDDIARQLETAWQDLPRRLLEAVAVEGYCSCALLVVHHDENEGLSLRVKRSNLVSLASPYGDCFVAEPVLSEAQRSRKAPRNDTTNAT